MKYLITYISEEEKATQLAKAAKANLILPGNEVYLVKADDVNSFVLNADTIFICFDFNRNILPLGVLELLLLFESQKLFFIISSGFEITDEFKKYVTDTLYSYVADESLIEGIFFCKGCFPKDILEKAEKEASTNPNNEYAKYLLRNSLNSKQHVDEEDLDNLKYYMYDILQHKSK